MIKRSAVVLASAVLVSAAVPAAAADHLVSRQTVTAALSAAASRRDRDTAAVDRVLASNAAQDAAAAIGVDLARLRGAVPTLSDSELRDLAERATALEADPAAGLSHDVEQLLIIFLIVAIVILVLQAV